MVIMTTHHPTVEEGLADLSSVIQHLGDVIAEERVRQAISTLGLVSRENTHHGPGGLKTTAALAESTTIAE